MDQRRVKASIIIRAYNAEATITRALKSALAQDFSGPYEVIIVDDGSTDNTTSIVERLSDARVRLVRQKENSGIIAAGNTGLNVARGQCIIFLDADDELLPHALSCARRVLSDRALDYAYADYFEEQGGMRVLVRPSDPFKAPIGGFLWRRERLLREGGFRGKTIFPEYEVLLQTWGRWKGVHLPEPLFVYHRRQESLTGDAKRVKNALDTLHAMYPKRAGEIARIRPYTL
ncbi:glycosyltransferase family 2 protein [Candidatus Kaiserbacteria bacterium]|nr:glycosyltransferase family 2 protein [Candidatus Kaiserbacteria bacterium]